MKREMIAPIADVEVVIRGMVAPGTREEAEEKIAALARYSRDPILHARVKLTRSGDPGRTYPVVAQANLDVNGRLVRAQVAAPDARVGIDLLVDVLQRRLTELARHWEARRGAQPSAEPHEWRHRSEPSHRPDYYPRPVEERTIVRHKTFELAQATLDEAIFDLDLMDYDFHLFTDLDSGQDSVVYRAGPTGYRLARLTPVTTAPPSIATALTVSEQPAPRLTQWEAIERLNVSGLPFVFYADEGTGRGQVLYRRYDGDYGLITPAT